MKPTSWIAGSALLFLALRLAAAPLDAWHWRNPSPNGNDLHGLAYGNARFVAVGSGGTVLVSTNGVDWETHLRFDAYGNPIHMSGVAFGNGVFIATESYYGMWVSTNGVDWVRSNNGPSTEAVFFEAGRFVAPGYSSIYTSIDGQNWTSTPVPGSGQLKGTASGNGTTILVGDQGRIAFTTNGLDWMAANSGATQQLVCATFDGQQFFAAGWLGALLVSSNGIDWTNRSVADPYYFLAAAAHGGRAVFAGYSYATVLNGNLTLIPTTDPTGVNALTVVNGEFWGVGQGGRILRSSDGLNWTEVSRRLVLPSSYYSFAGVAFDGNKFLAAGWNNIFASTNGANWTQLSSPPYLWIKDIAWGNGRFIAVGADISHPLGEPIGSSADGTNWVLHPVPTDSADQLQRVYFLNGRFVAVGWGGQIATSVSGTNWAVQSLGNNLYLSAAAYGEGKYLVGGMYDTGPENRHSVLFSSTDLVTWTSNSVPIAQHFWDMTYGRGIFLAAHISSGSPEGLMWSRDGVQWTSQPGFAERVIYQNGVFVIAGVNNISTSFNGREFRSRNRMFNQVPNGIAFGQGTYVVVGTGAMIIQSGTVPPAFMLSVEHDSPTLGPLLRLDAPFDAAYNVQSSSNGTSWSTFTTLQSTNGRFELRDTNAVGPGMKLYRAVLP
jgi:hypothetical protein